MSSVTPAAGPATGGRTVEVHGSGFTRHSRVRFGSAYARLVYLASTRLRVVTPRHAAGRVHVRVVTRYGTSTAHDRDRYSFRPNPVIGRVSPPRGPILGGQRITITGVHFAAVTSVRFGAVAGRGLHVISDTRIRVTTPLHGAGTYGLTLSGRYGTGRAVYTFVAPPAPLSWSTAQPVHDAQGRPGAPSCPTTTFCAQIDAHGWASTFDGVSWSAPVRVFADGARVYRLSCGAPSECVALRVLPGSATAVAVYSGSAWSSASEPFMATHPNFVSCTSAAFCLAVGSAYGDPPPTAWSYNGATWSAIPTPAGFAPVSLSCAPGSTYCLVGTVHGAAFAYSGSAWSGPFVAAPGTGPNDPSDRSLLVSCGTPTSCLVSGPDGLVRSWNGSQFGPEPSSGLAGTPSLSCVGAAWCAAVDGLAQVAVYSAGAWSAPVQLGVAPSVQHGMSRRGDDPVGVSCATTTWCAALSGAGNAFHYDGTEWTSAGRVDPDNALTAVSCPATSWCLAVDGAGGATVRAAGSWGATSDVDGLHALTDVSCAAAGNCVALDADGRALVLDAGSWSAPVTLRPGQPLTAVSCATTTFCAAVTGDGWAFTYGAGSWSGGTFLGVADVEGVSCGSVTACVAVSGAGEKSIAVRYSAGSWSAPVTVASGHYGFRDVSCSSATRCVAVESIGRAVPANGATWGPGFQFGGLASDFSISCVPGASTFCVSADADGAVFALTGAGWSRLVLVPQPTDVSCASAAFCVAVGPAGATVGTPAP